MMRQLLFLCQNLPYPPDGGQLIRSYHTLRLLSKEFAVTSLYFVRQRTRPTPADVEKGIEGLRQFGEVEVFSIPQESSSVRLLLDHARSAITHRAYTRWAYESKDFREALRRCLATRSFDVIHLDSLDLVAYLPDCLERAATVVAHHNIESELLARRARTSSGMRAAYFHFQAELLRREEALWCPQVQLNTVVSEADRALLEKNAPASKTLLVPNGVDTTAFRPDPDVGKGGIVFVGGSSWYPNLDAMEYFTEEILPLLREQPGATPAVTWVGRTSDSIQRRFTEAGIAVTGYVDDVRPYVQGAACFVVPIRLGGGTRLKILDAWALGAPIVSTRRGAEGLDARPGENILLADSPSDFARAVRTVLESEELRGRLGGAGRRTAVASYDWDAIGGPMLEVYTSLTL